MASLTGCRWRSSLRLAEVRTLDLVTLADSLTSHLLLLERPEAGGRHRSLTAAIEWSWQLLDQAERDLLCRLAALPADFTLSMAQAVAPGQTEANLQTCLLRLADRSLISVTLAAGQPARYRLLGTIRAYAAGRAPEVAAQVRHAHARHCCELAAAKVRVRRQPRLAQQPPPPPFDRANHLAR